MAGATPYVWCARGGHTMGHTRGRTRGRVYRRACLRLHHRRVHHRAHQRVHQETAYQRAYQGAYQGVSQGRVYRGEPGLLLRGMAPSMRLRWDSMPNCSGGIPGGRGAHWVHPAMGRGLCPGGGALKGFKGADSEAPALSAVARVAGPAAAYGMEAGGGSTGRGLGRCLGRGLGQCLW